MRKILITLGLLFQFIYTFSQSDSEMLAKLYTKELTDGQCYQNLEYLAGRIGGRLSGSPQSYKAIYWAQKTMMDMGFDSVWLQPVMVPHWVRGEKEVGIMKYKLENVYAEQMMPVCALGGSVATPSEGITAPVIVVDSISDLARLGRDKINGKIVLFNRPLDRSKISTFTAYGGAVDQRYAGPSEAAKYGAVATLCRSMDIGLTDHPHTGSMSYKDSLQKIPCAAISTRAATMLADMVINDPGLTFYIKMSCKTLPDTLSYNVVGEIKGSEKPDEIIAVGGHLDAWDNGKGAHDDGAGCVQSMEVLRLFHTLKIKPKRTIRCVLFMNEENGVKGGKKYAELAKANRENHIMAMESDAGGHTPRGFGISGDSTKLNKVRNWSHLFKPYHVYEFENGGGGTDIGPLRDQGVPLIGFMPDSQRYFDLHHTEIDTIENVNRRELELGAATMASLIYLISKYGW